MLDDPCLVLSFHIRARPHERPPSTQTFYSQDKQSRLVSFEHRLRMCELAFLDQDYYDSGDGIEEEEEEDGRSTRRRLRPPIVVVSTAERDSWHRAVALQDSSRNPAAIPEAVGTAALMEYLDETHPNDDFSFCLGEDSYRDLVAGKWREGERVLSRFRNRLYVVPRSGGKDPTQDGDGRNDNNDDDDGQSLLQLHGARWLSVPGGTRDVVSSSRVRAVATTAEQGDENAEATLLDLVSPAVLDYMREHRLYGFLPGGSVTK